MPADHTAVGACPTSARRRGLQRQRVEMHGAPLRVSAAMGGHRWRSVWMTPGPCRREWRGPQGACTAGGVLWPGSPGGQPSLVHVGHSAPSHGWEMPPLNIAHSAELTSIFSRGWEAARPLPASQRSHRCLYPVLLLGTLIGPPPAHRPPCQRRPRKVGDDRWAGSG